MREDLLELRRLYNGFQASRIILTANNLGLFDILDRKPRSAAELARAMRSDARATELMLNALTALGLLRKRRDRYGNAPIATRYLVKNSPHFQGDIIRHIDTLWKNWSNLDEIVRTGKPMRVATDHHSFIMGMHNLSVLKARKILSAIGLRGVQNALDLGAGPGTYAIEMAKRGISVNIFDTPETIRIARRVARKEGVKGIRFMGGDFPVDEIGNGYDLILISQILHAYSEDDSRDILSKCARALNPGGRVVIQEFPLNENHTRPPQGALFAINMLVHTEGGRTYTPREMGGWLRKAGLGKISVQTANDNVLISGKAPMS